MSKAFVKETDHEADLPDEPPAVPTGVKNGRGRLPVAA